MSDKEQENIKTGEVVVLRSGGPRMTTGGIKPNGSIVCQWFLDNELKSGEFFPLSLIKLSS